MDTPLNNTNCLHRRRHRRRNRRGRDQQRARLHQRRNDATHFVELLDAVGNRTMMMDSESRIPQIRHESVLSALATDLLGVAHYIV